jgi:hypothetical protein
MDPTYQGNEAGHTLAQQLVSGREFIPVIQQAQDKHQESSGKDGQVGSEGGTLSSQIVQGGAEKNRHKAHTAEPWNSPGMYFPAIDLVIPPVFVTELDNQGNQTQGNPAGYQGVNNNTNNPPPYVVL